MRKTMKKIITGVMTLGLVASMMPGMSMTAVAAPAGPTGSGTHITAFTGASESGGVITIGRTQITSEAGWDVPLTSAEATGTSATGTITDNGGDVHLTGAFNASGDIVFNSVTLNDSFADTNVTVSSVTGMVQLWKVTNGITGSEIQTVAATTPADNKVTNGKETGNVSDGTTYSVRNKHSFGVTVTPAANYAIDTDTKLFYKVGSGEEKSVAVAPDGKATIPTDDITADTVITKVSPLVKAVKVKATEETDDQNRVKVTGTKNNVDLVTGENNVPTKEDYEFAVAMDTGGTDKNVIIGKVSYKNPSGSWIDLGEGAGSYRIPKNVMEGYKAGEEVAIKVEVTNAIELTIAYDPNDTGVKVVKVNGEALDSTNKVVIPATSATTVDVALESDYELSGANLTATLTAGNSTVSTPQGLSFTVTPDTASPQNTTVQIGGYQAVAAADLVDITLEGDHVKFFDPDTGEELTSPVKAKKGAELKVSVVPDSGYDLDAVSMDGKTVNGTNGVYTITVPDDDATITGAASKSKDGKAEEDSKTDDGKTDDGKTDDGTTDDGKTDDGKTDDGKTDDGANSTGFADDSDIADYAKPYIKVAADAGIIKGVGDNKFDPKGSATRSAFATMIQRALGLKADKTASRFSDVTADLGEDLLNGVIACEDLDPFIVQGYPDGSFQPRKAVTRAEGILMIWRAAGKPAYTGAAKFNDLADWYAEAANWGAEQGIVQGVGDGKFDGGATLTRQDLATMLGRAIEKGIIKLPTAAADDKVDEAKTDETATDETKTDETKTDDSAAEGSSTEETKTEDTAA